MKDLHFDPRNLIYIYIYISELYTQENILCAAITKQTFFRRNVYFIYLFHTVNFISDSTIYRQRRTQNDYIQS